MTVPSLKIGIYRHYKGGLYAVLGVAHNEQTLEPMVVYQALSDSEEFGPNPLWVRPLNVFLETVHVDGKERPRFEFFSENMAPSPVHH